MTALVMHGGSRSCGHHQCQCAARCHLGAYTVHAHVQSHVSLRSCRDTHSETFRLNGMATPKQISPKMLSNKRRNLA